jgi:hypothetical protein
MMFRALSSVLLAFAVTLTAAAPVKPRNLTIVLDFKGAHSEKSIAAMKKELGNILGHTGLAFSWESPEEAAESTAENLVVVSFKGRCILEPVPYLYDERGPLAFTHSVDGEMQPFSEVECDTVTSSVRSAMFSGDYNKADLLLGRALGRVLAHELVHILTNSPMHAKEGVQRTALSGTQLIADHLKLTEADLLRVQGEARN